MNRCVIGVQLYDCKSLYKNISDLQNFIVRYDLEYEYGIIICNIIRFKDSKEVNVRLNALKQNLACQ